MIENVRAEFKNMLKNQVDWMDPDSKNKADEKVNHKSMCYQDS